MTPFFQAFLNCGYQRALAVQGIQVEFLHQGYVHRDWLGHQVKALEGSEQALSKLPWLTHSHTHHIMLGPAAYPDLSHLTVNTPVTACRRIIPMALSLYIRLR